MRCAWVLPIMLWSNPSLGESPSVQAAKAAESALDRAQGVQVRRSDLLRVVRLWQGAVFHAHRDERLQARRAEVAAWSRLACWSGEEEDHRRAELELTVLRREGGAPVPALGCPTSDSSTGRGEHLSSRPAGPPSSTPRPAEHRASSVVARGALVPISAGELSVLALDVPKASATDDPPLSIVLDPGHGGDELGAEGPGGILEKDVNLDVARRVAALLEGHVRVLLSRRGDDALSLADRVTFANRSDATLFVSIHANGHVLPRVRGIETYVLSVDAPLYSTRLRRREALLDQLFSTRRPEERRDLGLILADAAMRGATRRSRSLGLQIQAAMVRNISRRWADVPDLGVKSALFYVLLGVRMPAVLVEGGFLTHPEEGRLLGTGAYREALSKGIAEGIQRYIQNRSPTESSHMLVTRSPGRAGHGIRAP
ncbi:MAG: N-acetylmuramoyl-L-alanine amidase [Myxococcota bacterium]